MPCPFRGEGGARRRRRWEGEGVRRPPGKQPLTRARSLRRDQTDAEKLLWKHLRSGQLHGAKFRRQVWLGRYVSDFYCAAAQLVVEAGGGQHDGCGVDRERDEFMASEGLTVLRFWNDEVLRDLHGVLDVIAGHLPPSPSHPLARAGPSLSPDGRGVGGAPW